MEETMVETEDLHYCVSCGEELSEDDYVVFEEEDYCESCLDERTFSCERCGDRFSNDNNAGDDETPLCQRCYDRHYTRCDRCYCLVLYDDTYYDENDSDDRRYCCSCYEQKQDDYIHAYNYKPQPIFHGEGKRYMGVELEIDNGGKEDKHAKALCALANRDSEHIYIKHDGSINNGFEIVTHPMTFDYHSTIMPWKPLIEEALALNYRSHDTETCGLHVHVNRNSFGDDPILQDICISRILYFVERFWREMLLFSRRTQTQLERWAKRYGYSESPANILYTAKQRGNDRYMCVNLENHATIEFRIFRGTLVYNSLIATLQLVDEICNMASLLCDEELTNLQWKDFTRQIDFKKYPELIAYLNERGIVK